MIGECAVQIAGAAAVERVDDQRRLCLAQRLEMDELFKALQIVFVQIEFFAVRRLRRPVWKGRDTAFRGEPRGPSFDILGDFRKCRTRVGRGEFQPVILRGIVTGGEVNRAVEFAAHNFESDGGRRREGLTQQRSNPVVLQDVHRELGELFGVKARVVTHQDRGLLRLGFHVFRDRGDRKPHIGKREIIGDEAAPSRGAKLNRRVAHGALF